MYTEDDRYNNSRKSRDTKYKTPKRQENVSVSQSNDLEYDYYKDYYEDYSKTSKKTYKKAVVNDIDTSYTDDYSDGTAYQLHPEDVFNKKYVVIIILLIIALSVLVIVLVKTINVKTPPKGQSSNYVRLFYQELEMKIGDKEKLEVTLSATNENYKIEWYSNDDSVLLVDSNGNIEAVGVGEAYVLVAYYVDDMIYDAQCLVHVLK